MSKVSLIYPTLRNWESWPPLSLAHLAAFLERRGHEVEIIDRNVLLNRARGSMAGADKATRNALTRFQPNIVGLTATTPLLSDAYKCALAARETIPRAVLIMGGPHASLLPEETLREFPEIDLVCKGEGEFTLAELADGERPRNIRGLYYRENGDIRNTGMREMTREFDSLPLPARHLIAVKRYLRPTSFLIRGVEVRGTHIFSGRGCPGRCRFCAGHRVNGPGLRLHSSERVIEEIKHLVDVYHVNGLYYAEEMFLANRKRVTEICEWLIRSGYSKKVMGCANSRVDVLNPQLLALLKRAGFVQMEFGIESGSQRMLDLMLKGTNTEQNLRAIEMTKKAGIRVLANMIVGLPWETMEDLKATLEFLKKAKPHFAAINKFAPFPGSPLFDELREEGKLPASWDAYSQTDTTTNYCRIEDGTFIKEFLKLRARYYVLNTLNMVKFNFLRRPQFIFKSPYYMFKDPLRYAWRRATRRFHKPALAEATT